MARRQRAYSPQLSTSISSDLLSDPGATVAMLPSALVCSFRCGAHWSSSFRGCCHLSSDLSITFSGRSIYRNHAVTPNPALCIPADSHSSYPSISYAAFAAAAFL